MIEGIDRSVEEAAFSLGAPPATMFWRVLWPLALPGILAGTILTFILAMNAYATPFLLGGPLFKMMAPLIYNQFTSADQLAVRRRHRLHPDDGDPAADGRRQPDHPAPRGALQWPSFAVAACSRLVAWIIRRRLEACAICTGKRPA